MSQDIDMLLYLLTGHNPFLREAKEAFDRAPKDSKVRFVRKLKLPNYDRKKE